MTGEDSDPRGVRERSEVAPGVGGPAWEFKESAWGRLFGRGDPDVIARRLESAARAMLLAGVFVASAAFEPRTVDAFNLVKLTSAWFFGVLAAAAWFASSAIRPENRVVPRSPVVRAAAVVLLVAGLATVFSSNRTLSVFGLYHRYQGLVSLVLYAAFALLIVFAYRRRHEALRDLALAIGLASAVISAYVLVQALHIDPIPWRTATGIVPPNPLGSLGNPEFTSAFLGIGASFVLYLAITAKSMGRKICWIAVGCAISLSLIATAGRSGILAAIVGPAAFYMFRSKMRPARQLIAVLCLLLALTGIAFVIADTAGTTRKGLLRTGSVQYRAEMWKDAWGQALHRPVLGWGPDTYYGQFARFRSGLEARGQGITIPEEPHNIYLWWAAATGFPGLLAYIGLLGLALWGVANRARTARGGEKLVAAAFGAAAVGYLAQGLFSIDVPGLALIGWVVLGGIAALTEDRGAPSGGHGSGRTLDYVRTAVVGAVGVAAVAFLLVVGMIPLHADHAAWVGIRTSATWSAETMDEYTTARALNPREAAYPAFQAAYLERIAGAQDAPFTAVAALQRAARLYESAVSIQPRNELYILGAARVYERLGQFVQVGYFSEGDRWFVRAIRLDPRDPQLWDQYAAFMTKWQRAEGDPAKRAAISGRATAAAARAKALHRGPAMLSQ